MYIFLILWYSRIGRSHDFKISKSLACKEASFAFVVAVAAVAAVAAFVVVLLLLITSALTSCLSFLLLVIFSCCCSTEQKSINVACILTDKPEMGPVYFDSYRSCRMQMFLLLLWKWWKIKTGEFNHLLCSTNQSAASWGSVGREKMQISPRSASLVLLPLGVHQ